MANTEEDLKAHFAPANDQLQPEILSELESMLRLYSISPQELFFKWESYSIKMGSDDTKLDLKTSRDFKKDIQESLERENRGKSNAKHAEKKAITATPRSGGGSDVFGMLDSLVPNTPRSGALGSVGGSTVKRKSNFETPASKALKNHERSSPLGSSSQTPSNGISSNKVIKFEDRTDSGKVEQWVNDHIELAKPSDESPSEPRIKLKANTEMAKFAYKTMAMKLSEASEILDDRIDEFRELVQEHHNLEDGAFGNPSTQSTSEIIAVGRIASDSNEGKLNAASLVLESSRRLGSGLRVPLKVDGLSSYELFPGKIVAVRGTNASGEYFTVKEILATPLPPTNASLPSELDAFNSQLTSPDGSVTKPLTVFTACGPYSPDTSLDFSAFQALLDEAATTPADALILIGPFIDAEHPLVRSGDFDLPPTATSPDQAILADLFKYYIAGPLNSFAERVPSCQIILVPSVRDAVSRHAAWPQERLPKRELGLLKQIQVVTNPMTISLNEFMVGINSLDVLDMLRREECVGGKAKTGVPLERGARAVLEQRSFFPLFPPPSRESLFSLTEVEESVMTEDGSDSIPKRACLPTGASLDTSYLKLGEFPGAKPDILIMPSFLSPFTRFIEGSLVINPCTLSKRRGAGTFGRLTITPIKISEEENESGDYVSHKVHERVRAEVIRI